MRTLKVLFFIEKKCLFLHTKLFELHPYEQASHAIRPAPKKHPQKKLSHSFAIMLSISRNLPPTSSVQAVARCYPLSSSSRDRIGLLLLPILGSLKFVIRGNKLVLLISQESFIAIGIIIQLQALNILK